VVLREIYVLYSDCALVSRTSKYLSALPTETVMVYNFFHANHDESSYENYAEGSILRIVNADTM
jgi:hypothetical protein